MTAVLELTGLTKGFTLHHLGNQSPAFEGNSFSVDTGAFDLLKGANRVGDSSLLRAIFRSDPPQGGRMRLSSARGEIDLARAALVARLAQLKAQGTAMIGVFHQPGDVAHLIDRVIDLTPDAFAAGGSDRALSESQPEERIDVAL